MDGKVKTNPKKVCVMYKIQQASPPALHRIARICDQA